MFATMNQRSKSTVSVTGCLMLCVWLILIDQGAAQTVYSGHVECPNAKGDGPQISVTKKFR